MRTLKYILDPLAAAVLASVLLVILSVINSYATRINSTDREVQVVNSTLSAPVATAVIVEEFIPVVHTETPGEQAYADTMQSVGDEVTSRANALVEGVNTWGDEQYAEIVVLGEMMQETAGMESPAGYSQMKIYFDLAQIELIQARAMFEDGNREIAVVKLRNTVNYIHLAYVVQGLEE